MIRLHKIHREQMEEEAATVTRVRRKQRASSRYRGVSLCKGVGNWRAQVWNGHTVRHIGTFSTEFEAAVHYDREAFALFGNEAYLNFPELFHQGDVAPSAA